MKRFEMVVCQFEREKGRKATTLKNWENEAELFITTLHKKKKIVTGYCDVLLFDEYHILRDSIILIA